VLFTRKREAKLKGEGMDLADIDAQISDQFHLSVEELVNEYLGAAVAK